jgi:predicted PurR-regulated permease PerM
VVLLIGTAAIAVLARDLFHAAHRVIGWAAAAVVVAALLDLPIGILARKIGRVAAVALTFVAVAATVIALVYGAFDNLRTEADRFQRSAPAAAAQLEQRTDRVGEIARDLKLEERTTQLADAVDERLGGGGSHALLSSAGSAPTYFVGAILAIFFMTFGPRIVRDGLLQIDDDDRRQRATQVLRRALVKSRSAILVAMVQGVLTGLLVGGTCRALDLPAPITVGLFGALVGLVPYLGIVMAYFPVALLAAGFRSVESGIVILVIALVLQTFEGVWLRPRLDRSTMRIGAAVPWLVGLIGFSVYGVGGALYGAAYAVFGLAVIDAVDLRRRADEISAAISSPSSPTSSSSPSPTSH